MNKIESLILALKRGCTAEEQLLDLLRETVAPVLPGLYLRVSGLDAPMEITIVDDGHTYGSCPSWTCPEGKIHLPSLLNSELRNQGLRFRNTFATCIKPNEARDLKASIKLMLKNLNGNAL